MNDIEFRCTADAYMVQRRPATLYLIINDDYHGSDTRRLDVGRDAPSHCPKADELRAILVPCALMDKRYWCSAMIGRTVLSVIGVTAPHTGPAHTATELWYSPGRALVATKCHV
jgi:hypothetical protein